MFGILSQIRVNMFLHFGAQVARQDVKCFRFILVAVCKLGVELLAVNDDIHLVFPEYITRHHKMQCDAWGVVDGIVGVLGVRGIVSSVHDGFVSVFLLYHNIMYDIVFNFLLWYIFKIHYFFRIDFLCFLLLFLILFFVFLVLFIFLVVLNLCLIVLRFLGRGGNNLRCFLPPLADAVCG